MDLRQERCSTPVPRRRRCSQPEAEGKEAQDESEGGEAGQRFSSFSGTLPVPACFRLDLGYRICFQIRAYNSMAL